MDCIVIDNKNDVEFNNCVVNYLTIKNTTKILGILKFEVRNSEKDLIYKCKLNPLMGGEHAITNSNNKPIVKFKFIMNEDKSGFELIIKSKNLNEDGSKEKDYIVLNCQPKYGSNISDDTRRYVIDFYNKSIENDDVLELVDKSQFNNTNSNYLNFDYRVYHGSDDFNSSICDVSQSYKFNSEVSINIQPGVEPLFMVVLYICIFVLNSYKNNGYYIKKVDSYVN